MPPPPPIVPVQLESSGLSESASSRLPIGEASTCAAQAVVMLSE